MRFLDLPRSFLDGTTLEPVAPPRDAAAGFVIDLLALGDTPASLGSDGDVRLWDVGTWLDRACSPVSRQPSRDEGQ